MFSCLILHDDDPKKVLFRVFSSMSGRFELDPMARQMKYEGGANPREGIIENVFEVSFCWAL